MPGDIIRYSCCCGMRGVVAPGVMGLSWDAGSEEVIAYNPKIEAIETMSRENAKNRNLRIYRNPFLNDPMGFTKVIKNCLCPKCNNATLEFERLGVWD